MTIRLPKWLVVLAAFAVLAGGFGVGGYLLGEASVDEGALRAEGYEAGESAGHEDGYEAGLARGREIRRGIPCSAGGPCSAFEETFGP